MATPTNPAPTPGATFTPPPTVHPGNTGRSFYTAQIPELARWLSAAGYDAELGCTPYEYARMWHAGALVVLYHSGTALVQGPAPAHALATLGALLRPGQQGRAA